MSLQPMETYRQRNQEMLQHMKAAPNLKQFRKERKKSLNSQIFRIEKEDLCEFFKPYQHKKPKNIGECRTTLNMLKECQYNAGLCRLLGTDQKTGIIGDAEDIERRQRFFGKHLIPQPKVQDYMTILYMQFEDSNVIYLIWVATFYLVFSFFSSTKDKSDSNGYIESLTIYFGLMFACLLSAYCDHKKQQQHLKISDQVNDQMVTVYRGAYGTALSVPVRNLVVGDIVQLSQGDRVPADCIILNELNLVVDESIYWKKYQVDKLRIKKDESQCFLNQGNLQDTEGEPDNHKTNPDFTLLSDSKIMKGECRAIVCAVGEMTYLSTQRGKEQLIIKEQRTNLEKKLETVGDIVGKWCYLLCIGIAIILIVYNILHMLFSGDKSLFSNETLLMVLRIVILSLCLVIVAIPEGMPLAISLAMAMSVDAMKEDNILIKNIQKVQVCALLHQVCVGKTGTLTEGNLHVGSYQLIGEQGVHENKWKDIRQKGHFNTRMNISEDIDPKHNDDLKSLIRESILANTDVRLEVDEGDHQAVYSPKGQAIEVGMINFLFENGEDVYEGFNVQNKHQEKIFQLPFDQTLKRKTVVRADSEDPEVSRVYVKGAPEEIIPLCIQTLDTNVEPVDFTPQEQSQVLNIIAIEIARERGHKPISYGFKMVQNADLNKVLPHVNEDSPEYRKIFESDLIYLGTFGLEDQIRDEAKKEIEELKMEDSDDKQKGVQIKMISGDHIETAKYVARQTGIISENEPNLDKTVITGEEFRKRMGPYKKVYDRDTMEEIFDFEDKGAFKELDKKVKVIARATPTDKLILIRAIRQAKGMIGMAGDSIADAEALEAADVGLCMGSGCDVAKDKSDLIIVNNNFSAITKSIQWGKAMFENSRKFIVFQFTVSNSMLCTCFISALSLGNLPFNVIQMLWINLVMDILAAIALGTSKDVNKTDGRFSRKFKVFEAPMWRQILVQSAFQILVNLIFLYFGGIIFNKPYNLITTDPRNESKMFVDTFVFNTFFMMTMFNQINSRIIDGETMNVFKTVKSNMLFWMIWGLEIGIQVLMLLWCNTEMGQTVLGMVPLTFEYWALSAIIGSLSLAVHVIQIKVPLKKFEDLNKSIGLDEEGAANQVDMLYGKIYGKLHNEDDVDSDDDNYKRMDNRPALTNLQPQTQGYDNYDEPEQRKMSPPKKIAPAARKQLYDEPQQYQQQQQPRKKSQPMYEEPQQQPQKRRSNQQMYQDPDEQMQMQQQQQQMLRQQQQQQQENMRRRSSNNQRQQQPSFGQMDGMVDDGGMQDMYNQGMDMGQNQQMMQGSFNQRSEDGSFDDEYANFNPNQR